MRVNGTAENRAPTIRKVARRPRAIRSVADRRRRAAPGPPREPDLGRPRRPDLRRGDPEEEEGRAPDRAEEQERAKVDHRELAPTRRSRACHLTMVVCRGRPPPSMSVASATVIRRRAAACERSTTGPHSGRDIRPDRDPGDALRARRRVAHRLPGLRRRPDRPRLRRPVVQQRRCHVGLPSPRAPAEPTRVVQPGHRVRQAGYGVVRSYRGRRPAHDRGVDRRHPGGPRRGRLRANGPDVGGRRLDHGPRLRRDLPGAHVVARPRGRLRSTRLGRGLPVGPAPRAPPGGPRAYPSAWARRAAR